MSEGPRGVLVPAAIREAILAHAAAEAPLEACGIVVGSAPAGVGGTAIRYVPTRNALASPYRFEVDPRDLVRLTIETDAVGQALWAIVHSHTRTEARPSPTDVEAARYPDAVYLVVGPMLGGEPQLRAWRIAGGEASELRLESVVPS